MFGFDFSKDVPKVWVILLQKDILCERNNYEIVLFLVNLETKAIIMWMIKWS